MDVVLVMSPDIQYSPYFFEFDIIESNSCFKHWPVSSQTVVTVMTEQNLIFHLLLLWLKPVHLIQVLLVTKLRNFDYIKIFLDSWFLNNWWWLTFPVPVTQSLCHWTQWWLWWWSPPCSLHLPSCWSPSWSPSSPSWPRPAQWTWLTGRRCPSSRVSANRLSTCTLQLVLAGQPGEPLNMERGSSHRHSSETRTF